MAKSKAAKPAKKKPAKKVTVAQLKEQTPPGAMELLLTTPPVLPMTAPVTLPPVEELPKQPSGWAKVKAAGKRGIMLVVTPEEYAKLDAAAKADRRSLSGWIVYAALQQTKFVLESN